MSNSTESTAANATLIKQMEDCNSPIYEVMNVIANHSDKLFIMINDWQDTVNGSESDGSIIMNAMANTADQDNLYLCDAPM